MSDSDHAKKPRRYRRVRTEGITRSRVRRHLALGQWDEVDTTTPTRAIRRPTIAG